MVYNTCPIQYIAITLQATTTTTTNGQLAKQGAGNENRKLHKSCIHAEIRQLLVEILFTNISRDESWLTAILFTNKGAQQWTSEMATHAHFD